MRAASDNAGVAAISVSDEDKEGDAAEIAGVVKKQGRRDTSPLNFN